MKIFEHSNYSHGHKCIICNTTEDKPVVLVGIVGTQENNVIEAEQIHVDCIELLIDKSYNLIYQKYE